MGFVLLGYVLLWTIGYIIILSLTIKYAKSKKTVIFVIVILILYPLRRLILFKTLFFFYSLSPLQEIHDTVKSPGSVYWEDNVWPGYDEYGRFWMISSYLDGINLKVLALNGEDGRIYLYRAEEQDYKQSKIFLPEINKQQRKTEESDKEVSKRLQHAEHLKGDEYSKVTEEFWESPYGKYILDQDSQLNKLKEKYRDQRKKDVQAIMSRAEVYVSTTDLPPIVYTVRFNSIKIVWPLNKLLHADKITISDNRKNKEIAYSRRYMAYAALITQFSGQQPEFDYKLGDERVNEFDDQVLFRYADIRSPDWDRNYLKRGSYKSSTLYWKSSYGRSEK